jgi:UDP-N-acetylglucosamine--N-acetylmuramyl-(pentapeptide) pyrophosphoryl-undecaprenol N-acetylglucosamine transferase
MDLAYGAADVVVSRAGAITCSELMVTGSPAVLIPALAVAEDHQTKNARALADRGGAELLPETDTSRLSGLLDALLRDKNRLRSMREALLEMAQPDAAKAIAADVLNLAGAAT